MKETIETKAYSIRLLPNIRKNGNTKAKKSGKTFSSYVSELIAKDLQETK